MTQVTVSTLRKMKEQGDKIASLTAYDASFASLVDAAGVEAIIVGDSLGMVIQGQSATIAVTVDEMVYHTRLVRQGTVRSLVIADMPFLTYSDPGQAVATGARLMKEGGAHMVKLEGGAPVLESVARLSAFGVPVCAHLGLLPQSVHKLGGYRVQGRDATDAERILREARQLEDAGADALVLECVPSRLAAEITAALSIPVIGIGAGPECDGQVLVLYDMLAITRGTRPRFSKDFLSEGGSIQGALEGFVQAVKQREFPGPEHCFE